MQKYAEILSLIVQKELVELTIAIIIIFLIIAITWSSNIIYYHKKQKKNPRKFSSKKYVKERRKVFWSCVALTVILSLICALQLTGYLSTSAEIKQDIENQSYIIFNGDYSITDVNLLHYGFERWEKLEMEDGKYAYVYNDNIFDWLSTDEKEHKGKIVYGENSLVVVELQ